MDIINLIRIEHPNSGLGLFNAKDNDNINNLIDLHSKSKQIYERHSNYTVFPPIYYDNELQEQISFSESKNYCYGFLSIEQLNNALTKDEIKEFINVFGFKIYSIKCTQYYKSKYQIIFLKESILSKEDISYLFI